MPVEILALAVAEGTAEPCVVEASLQEVQDLVDTEGVRAVDLCGKTVTGRQGKVLQVRRPGVTLRNGRLDVRGGAVRLWYRSGRGEDAWAGLVVRGEGCALEGIELTGVRESGYGVAIDNVGACRMVDCRFWRMGETGGWVVGEQSDVRMTRCTFSENGGYGLLVSDGGTLVSAWRLRLSTRGDYGQAWPFRRVCGRIGGALFAGADRGCRGKELWHGPGGFWRRHRRGGVRVAPGWKQVPRCVCEGWRQMRVEGDSRVRQREERSDGVHEWVEHIRQGEGNTGTLPTWPFSMGVAILDGLHCALSASVETDATKGCSASL